MAMLAMPADQLQVASAPSRLRLKIRKWTGQCYANALVRAMARSQSSVSFSAQINRKFRVAINAMRRASSGFNLQTPSDCNWKSAPENVSSEISRNTVHPYQ